MEKKHGDIYARVGLNILYYRKKQGLTQLQLAEAANYSLNHIQQIDGKDNAQRGGPAGYRRRAGGACDGAFRRLLGGRPLIFVPPFGPGRFSRPGPVC